MRSLEGFFDADWYLEKYPDIAAAGLDPLLHFIRFGLTERRDPNPFFDTGWYAVHYYDVGVSGALPLIHYVTVGAREQRNPHPRFDAAWYIDQHPEAEANPLVYHMRVGRHRGYPTEKPLDIRDWLPSSLAPLRPPRGRGVDVIVPAYRGLKETRICLETVLADTERPAGSVIVIDDHSPEKALSAYLDKLAKARSITLIRNRRNLGFVASVNLGMRTADPSHDVILLNSDTEVPAGWITRLSAQAWSGPRIASVSPFSNNATICSYPRNEGWDMPFGLSLAELDLVCRGVNAGRSVRVPTTVGFCMYIRRDALNDVGLFDEKAFGRGYGEENDFCLRASARGWTHLLACDTFVYHAGAVSFRDDSKPSMRAARDILLARYPDYERVIERHVRNDAVGPFRFAITTALFRRSSLPVILLVSHDMGGGVRRHIDVLVERFKDKAHYLLLAATERGVELTAPAIPGHPNLALTPAQVEELLQVLQMAAVRRVHIHHLAGVEIDIRALIHRLGVPFDVTIHDYIAICPQVGMLPWTELSFCGEPGPGTCNACIGHRSSYGARDIVSWRRENAWQFLEADRVICPSVDAVRRLTRFGFGHRAVAAPHDPTPTGRWVVRSTKPTAALRVAVIGVLANHKGARIVAAVAQRAREAGIEITLIGYPEVDFPEEIRPLFKETGRYQEAELPGLLEQARPHVVWFPASFPETYSYTLSAALAAELPIVATHIGAFPERLEGRPLTWVIEPSQSADDWLAVFDDVRTALRAAKPTTVGGERPAAPYFYAEEYMAPLSAPAIRPAGALIDLRRDGHKAVVVVPERFGPNLLSPCAYIRLLQPLDHPAIADALDVVVADAATAMRYRADVIATQRYAIRDAGDADALVAHARASGASLLYDMDDDLLDIPRTHADAAELRPLAKVVRRLVTGADQVWVSTPTLAERIQPLQPSVRIVPNGLDERLWLHHRPHSHDEFGPVRMIYMGTATHAADLAIIAPAVQRLLRDHPNHVSLDIVGVTPDLALPEGIRRINPSANGSASYPGFVNWITTQQAWDIGLAPLADTPFNRSKSTIKTYDYAALGLAVLASDGPVYKASLADGAGGMLVHNDTESWYAAISLLIRDPDRRRRLAAGARQAFLATGTLASQAADRRAAWMALGADRQTTAEVGVIDRAATTMAAVRRVAGRRRVRA